MGNVVYAAAMSHVLYPDYYGNNVGPHRRRMVGELLAVVRKSCPVDGDPCPSTGRLRQASSLLAPQRMAGTLVDLYAAAGLAR